MKEPKDKAAELVEKFSDVFGWKYLSDEAIDCAKIAVDEILKSQPIEPNNSKPLGGTMQSIRQNFADANEYWQQVRSELDKL